MTARQVAAMFLLVFFVSLFFQIINLALYRKTSNEKNWQYFSGLNVATLLSIVVGFCGQDLINITDSGLASLYITFALLNAFALNIITAIVGVVIKRKKIKKLKAKTKKASFAPASILFGLLIILASVAAFFCIPNL